MPKVYKDSDIFRAWDEEGFTLRDFQELLKKTVDLLDSDETGCMSWNMLLNERCREISAMLKKGGY